MRGHGVRPGSLWVAVGAAAWLGVAPWGSSARAGGLEVGDNGTRALARGGAFVALADDLTAIIHNPAGLLHSRGTRFLYNHNLSWAHLSLERQPSVVDAAGFDDLANPARQQNGVFPLGISLALGSDFGLEDWYFALGVYGPSSAGNLSYPADGVQRYLMTSLEAALMYFTAAVAYGDRERWGVGVSLQAVHAPFVRFGLMVDGQPNNTTGVNPHRSPFDVAAEIDMRDPFSFTAILGGWWRPIPEIELAVASRVIPVTLNLRGDVNMAPVGSAVANSELIREGTSAEMNLTLPAYVRAGARYRHLVDERELFDIELDVVWEGWSAVRDFDIALQGSVGVPPVVPVIDLPDLSIPRRWRDTIAIRLGGTFNPMEWLGVSVGGYWESAAVPRNYEHIDFPSFQRFGLAGGLRFRFDAFDLNVAYMHVFQETREVDERFGKVMQIRPVSPCDRDPARCNGSTTGVPANTGRYRSSFDIVSIGVEVHFDSLFRP